MTHPEIIKKELELKDLKEAKARAFRKKNKAWLNTLTSFFILAILLQSACVVITHAMVAKATPEAEYGEVNAVTGEALDLQKTPMSGLESIKYIFWWILVWGIMGGWYVLTYFKISSDGEMYGLTALVVFLFIVYLMNFANDFGFWLGKALSALSTISNYNSVYTGW